MGPVTLELGATGEASVGDNKGVTRGASRAGSSPTVRVVTRPPSVEAGAEAREPLCSLGLSGVAATISVLSTR